MTVALRTGKHGQGAILSRERLFLEPLWGPCVACEWGRPGSLPSGSCRDSVAWGNFSLGTMPRGSSRAAPLHPSAGPAPQVCLF